MLKKAIFPVIASLLLSACSLNPVSELTPTPTNTISPSLNQEATPTQEQEVTTQTYSMDQVAIMTPPTFAGLVLKAKSMTSLLLSPITPAGKPSSRVVVRMPLYCLILALWVQALLTQMVPGSLLKPTLSARLNKNPIVLTITKIL